MNYFEPGPTANFAALTAELVEASRSFAASILAVREGEDFTQKQRLPEFGILSKAVLAPAKRRF